MWNLIQIPNKNIHSCSNPNPESPRIMKNNRHKSPRADGCKDRYYKVCSHIIPPYPTLHPKRVVAILSSCNRGASQIRLYRLPVVLHESTRPHVLRPLPVASPFCQCVNTDRDHGDQDNDKRDFHFFSS